MGKRYVAHSDMCGCDRCAAQYETDSPRQVFDVIDDPDVMDCGCDSYRGCACYQYNDVDD